MVTTATDPRSAYYSAEKNVIIDLINHDTGLTHYAKETAEQIRERYPDAELISLDEAYQRHQQPFIVPVSEITEKKFWYWLEVLFPEDWQHSGGESFKVCERICGDITQICCSLNDYNPDTKAPRQRRYFTLCDTYDTPHKDIVSRCREFMRAKP